LRKGFLGAKSTFESTQITYFYAEINKKFNDFLCVGTKNPGPASLLFGNPTENKLTLFWKRVKTSILLARHH